MVEAPLDASVPLAPPDVPELELPLGALELVELAASPVGAEELPPPALEPYCFTQLSRSSPTMPAHWLGVAPIAPLIEVSLAELPAVDVLGVLGDVAASDELLLVWAHAAPAKAMVIAAVIVFSIM